MNNIRVDIRLRPIRFGFLVRPDDAENILEIFRINTCLWGGMFNPIIPFFESVPAWLEKEGCSLENTKQIIDGYLDFFEPDFLVEAEDGLADGFDFDPNRVVPLKRILEEEGKRGWDGYGLSVIDLYRYLYTKEFQFERRHKEPVVNVQPADSTFDNFVAANFGSFPIQEQFGYFERDYKGVFDPEHKTLDANELSRLYKAEYVSPLRIGHDNLRIDYHERLLPTLFILDAQASEDLVEFWNLRAIHKHVLAIPVQWITALASFCKEFKPKRHALMFAHSLPEERGKEIRENYLRVNQKQSWWPSAYLPLWRNLSRGESRTTRPTLAAAAVSRMNIYVQIDEDNPEIQFDPLLPEFAAEYGNRHRVANVVRLQNRSSTGQIATVFPCNYRKSAFPKFGLAWDFPLPTKEGFVIFLKHRNLAKRWGLTDGTTAFNQWFKNNQISATPSDAGRATQQIIQTLGDFEDVGCLAHKGVIQLLNKIASRPVSKTIHYQKFRKKIDNAVANGISGKSIFETLVKRRAVEIGLDLKCNKCSKWSWYSVKQLDYSLICNFCFKPFDFPVVDPIDNKHSKWAYRLIGPFAQPDYAQGGYAAALAIRFFANVINEDSRAEATWSSGQELELPTGKKVESDFILWNQHKEPFGLDYLTDTVFGEAKSFYTFEQKDIDKIKLLAESSPGSILVFAAMKDGPDFSKKEIERLKKLAEWGREYDNCRKQSRAPVIILTGTELFTKYSLKDSWEKKGGKHKEIIERAQGRFDNLRVLADLTQQLYLGMPPNSSTNSFGETTWFSIWNSVGGADKS